MARKKILKIKIPKKTNIKKILLIVLGILFFLGVVYFLFKTLVVAKVNGQLINRFSVIKKLESEGGKSTIDSLITTALIKQEANKRGIKISQEEIDGQLSEIEKNMISQGTTLDAVLIQQGLTRESLKETMILQLMMKKLVNEKINVSEKEIDDYIVTLKAQGSFPPDEVLDQATRDQIKSDLEQQKLDTKYQEFLNNIREKADIDYFISY